MADMEGKTEQPTPRRRSKAREEGQIPVSQDVVGVAVLIASLATLAGVVGFAGEELARFVRAIFGQLHLAVRGDETEIGSLTLSTAAKTFMPVAVAGAVASIAATMGQTQGLFNTKRLTFDFTRFNPLPKLRQMFGSKDALISILQQAAKAAVIVAFTWQLLWQEIEQTTEITSKMPAEILAHIWSSLLSLCIRVVGILVVFAAIDFLIVRWRSERELKMSKQEVKDENRESEGDPEVKRHQRLKQRDNARKLMMAQVKRADVVVVNPTHYAVALRYDSSTMQAPQLVAKGKDEVAARIREEARRHSIPIVHNPPLARSLYAEVKLGRGIPGRLFGAVAEVLAYVYRLRGRIK